MRRRKVRLCSPWRWWLSLLSAAVLLSAALLAAGCNGARETDEVAFVLAVGVDQAPNNQITVTYQVAVPRKMSGGSDSSGKGGGDSGEAFTTMAVTAPSLAEARNLLNSGLSRVPNLSHSKVFVVGEGLARHGLGDTIGPLIRFREFRGSMFIMVARGTAKDFLEKNKPVLETLPAKYVESMMSSADETGYYLPTNLHDFYNRLKSGSAAPFAVMAAINPRTGQGRPAGTRVPGEEAPDYQAGDIPRDGGDPAELIGLAVFHGDKMTGILSGQETRMLAMLLNKYPRGFIVVSDPLAPTHNVNVNIRQPRPPRIKVAMADDHPVISVDVLLEGEVTSIPSGISYEGPAYRPLLEAQISRVVQQEMTDMLRRTQAYQADVAGFGYYLRPQFATYQEWAAADWNSLYCQADINVTVNTQLHRTGLMWQTSPLR